MQPHNHTMGDWERCISLPFLGPFTRFRGILGCGRTVRYITFWGFAEALAEVRASAAHRIVFVASIYRAFCAIRRLPWLPEAAVELSQQRRSDLWRKAQTCSS